MKTIINFIGVWFVASSLNGFLSGTCIAMFSVSGAVYKIPGAILLACLFSFLFSIPFVGLVWIITVIARMYGKTGHALFQIILATTFLCAFAGSLFFIYSFGIEFREEGYLVMLSIIISAAGSVLFFRDRLKDA